MSDKISVYDLSPDEFARQFIQSVEYFYQEYCEQQQITKLPDFDSALLRAKMDGVEAIEKSINKR